MLHARLLPQGNLFPAACPEDTARRRQRKFLKEARQGKKDEGFSCRTPVDRYATKKKQAGNIALTLRSALTVVKSPTTFNNIQQPV